MRITISKHHGDSDEANLQVIAADTAVAGPDAASNQSTAGSPAGKRRRRLASLAPRRQPRQAMLAMMAVKNAIAFRQPTAQTLWAGVAATLRGLRARLAALMKRLAGWTPSLWGVAGRLRSAHTSRDGSSSSTDGVPLPFTAQPGVPDCCSSSHRLDSNRYHLLSVSTFMKKVSLDRRLDNHPSRKPASSVTGLTSSSQRP